MEPRSRDLSNSGKFTTMEDDESDSAPRLELEKERCSWYVPESSLNAMFYLLVGDDKAALFIARDEHKSLF